MTSEEDIGTMGETNGSELLQETIGDDDGQKYSMSPINKKPKERKCAISNITKAECTT